MRQQQSPSPTFPSHPPPPGSGAAPTAMSENDFQPRAPRKGSTKKCCCAFAECGRNVDRDAHSMASFKDNHLRNVVKQLVNGDTVLERLILTNPSAYRVHTCHFSEKDKQKKFGKLCVAPGAQPLPRSKLINLDHQQTANATTATTTTHVADTPQPSRPMLQRSPSPIGGARVPLADMTSCFLSFSSPPPRAPVHAKRRRIGMTNGLSNDSLHASPSPAVTPLIRPRPSPPCKPAQNDASSEAVVARHLRAENNMLKQQLEACKQQLSNAKVDASTAYDKNRQQLLQHAKEKQILEEQYSESLRNLRTSQEQLDAVRMQLAAKGTALDKILSISVVKLSWESITGAGSPWSDCVSHLTGISSVKALVALFNLLNFNGVADRLRYWNGKATIKRMERLAEGTTQRSSRGHQWARSFTSGDAFVVTLVKLRTGLGTKVISSWSGIPVGNLSRIFTTWIAYMDNFFKSECPVPTTGQMANKYPEDWKEAYGTSLIRFVLDCTEFRIQQPCSRKAARTCWSDYKHAHTAKLLAAILPTGAYCGTSAAYPGRISDTDILAVSHWLKILQRGDCIPADKGFDQVAHLLHAVGAHLVAPCRRAKGVKSYTADERDGNEQKSNLRIHVERHFSRVQNWQAFSAKKIPLYSVDMIEKAFNVVSHLCNLSAPLIASTTTTSSANTSTTRGEVEDEVF